MAYGGDLLAPWARAAGSIAQILNGASPGDIPIYRPEKHALVIHLKAANAIGLTIAPSLLDHAEEVSA